MIFSFFGGKIVFFFFGLLKYNHHCEYFYYFIKFFGWIVAIWLRLVKLIVEKRSLTSKMKNIITIKKKKRTQRPEPPWVCPYFKCNRLSSLISFFFWIITITHLWFGQKSLCLPVVRKVLLNPPKICFRQSP